MADDTEDIVLIGGVGLIGLVLYTNWDNIFGNNGGYNPPGNNPPPATGCIDSLWNYVWQIPGTTRMQVIKSCLTVTGIVGRTSAAPDGDYNFELKLDPAYSQYRSTAGSHGTNIWCEMICQKPLRNSSGAD